MAWLDDRIWCHPKLNPLSDKAFRAHINGITYASGFSTGGVLSDADQRTIGCPPRIRKELIENSLWEQLPGNAVRIHDWDEHNAKRDERKAADRERKRKARAKPSAGRPTDNRADSPHRNLGTNETLSAGQPTDKHADRRTLTGEGSTEVLPKAVALREDPEPPLDDDEPSLDPDDPTAHQHAPASNGTAPDHSFTPPTLRTL